MCGPSTSEKNLEANEASFAQQLQQNYAQNFADQQAVLTHLNSVLSPILEAGPNQTGFSPQEAAALNTQAIDTTGAQAANAERAVGNELAGRNDSGNLPESGVDQALKAQIASSAAGQLSSEQLGITEANYATGRQNFAQAVGEEQGLAGQYNPVSTGSLASGTNASAFGEANQIAQQQSQELSDIGGGVLSLATGAAGGIGNLDETGHSTPGEQIQNFFAGFGG